MIIHGQDNFDDNGSGTTLADAAYGGADNDGISTGNDTFDGLEGNDTIFGGDGNDVGYGSADNDQVYGSTGSDVAYGGTGDDVLFGGADNDIAYGGDGSDRFFGNPGNDTFFGGTLFSFARPDRIDDFDFVDYNDASGFVVVNLSAGTASGSGAGNDTFSGVEGVRGSAGNDTLIGGSGGAIEAFQGRGGNDRLAGDGVVNTRAEYGDATGSIHAVFTAGTSGNGTVTGAGVGTDTLSDINYIRGSNFNDTIDYSAYSNILVSSLLVPFTDVRGEAGNDTVLGNGYTRLEFVNATGSVVVNFAAGTAHDGQSGTDTFSGVREVQGGDFDDTFYGGGPGELNFFEAYRPGAGNDVIYGGTDSDEVNYSSTDPLTIGVTVNMAAGTVTGDPTASGLDRLFSVERVAGSLLDDVYDATGYAGGNARLSYDSGALVNAAANRFSGNAGNDTIIGNGSTAVFGASGQNAEAGVVGAFTGQGSGTISGDASVGFDTFTGAEVLGGTRHNDTLIGSDVTVAGYVEQFRPGPGYDLVNGGGGVDFVSYDEDVLGGIEVDLGLGTMSASDGTGNDVLLNIEEINGTDFNDTLIGGGTSGPWEAFFGGDGDDTIDGKGGLDFLDYRFGPIFGPLDGSGVTVDMAAHTAFDPWHAHDTFSNIEGVRGSMYADLVTGDADANTIYGKTGNDHALGAGGDDVLVGDEGGDLLEGGDGNDTLDGGKDGDGFVAGAGNDVLYGGAAAGSGVDWMIAGDGQDRAWGGDDGDVLFGDDMDTAPVTGGADTLYGDGGSDYINGGLGNDLLYGGASFDWVEAAGGDDTVFAAEGDFINGEGGNDVIYGSTNAADAVFGLDGNDVVYGGDAGAVSDDFLWGDDFNGNTFAGNDTLFGGAGVDVLFGGLGNDLVYGGDDDDYLQETGGDNRLFGGAGIDYLIGGSGIETLDGGNGSDVIGGADGNDLIYGGAGADLIFGGGGDDIIDAGPDSGDQIFGDAGNDTLVVRTDGGWDQLADWNAGDRIDVSAFSISVVTIDSAGPGNVHVSGAGGAFNLNVSLDVGESLTQADFIF